MKHGGQEKYLRGRMPERIIETAECLRDHSKSRVLLRMFIGEEKRLSDLSEKQSY
jgi:hypothetical protein